MYYRLVENIMWAYYMYTQGNSKTSIEPRMPRMFFSWLQSVANSYLSPFWLSFDCHSLFILNSKNGFWYQGKDFKWLSFEWEYGRKWLHNKIKEKKGNGCSHINYLQVSEFALPNAASLVIPTETLKVEYLSLTTFIPEWLVSWNPFSIDWTFWTFVPSERK